MMEPAILSLIREIDEKTQGTEQETLGRLVIYALRELTSADATTNARIDGIIRQRDTGRMDI